MLERFTDRARRAVILAQEEARLLKHSSLGTEHLLLGLEHEGEGIAARALDGLGVTLEAARREVEDLIEPGTETPTGEIPFTPRLTAVFELAFREAIALGQNYIGTEHLLLGLVREGEGVAAQVLVRLAGGLDRVRQAVLASMTGSPVPVADAEPISPGELEGLLEQQAPMEPAGELSPEGNHLVMHASVAAQRHGHGYLRPEHLLLAMFDIATGPVHEAIDDLGLSPTSVGEKVLEALPETEAPATRMGTVAPTVETARVLERAISEANLRGLDQAGPGHILFSLIQDEAGTPHRIVVDFVGNHSAVSTIVERAADQEGREGVSA